MRRVTPRRREIYASILIPFSCLKYYVDLGLRINSHPDLRSFYFFTAVLLDLLLDVDVTE